MPLGPVAAFGAPNFPLAFSTAASARDAISAIDTAIANTSALAARCAALESDLLRTPAEAKIGRRVGTTWMVITALGAPAAVSPAAGDAALHQAGCAHREDCCFLLFGVSSNPMDGRS